MAFQNLLFIFFLFPLFLIAYQLIHKRLRAIFLVGCSLFFYAWGEPLYVALLIFLIVFNYFMGRHIAKQQGKQRILAFLMGLTGNLFILFYFKYYSFFLAQLVQILPLPPYHELPLMPLGISFYLFSIIAYQIDVYSKKIPCEKNLLHFALYVSWFPKLIMGPIQRYEDFKKQLPLQKITKKGLEKGLVQFLIGLLQKLFVANQLAVVWQAAQNSSSMAMAWLGILAYTLEIYFDFQGYTQMAIGISNIIGIQLPENFDYPYVATSITDFWRRWHKTLSFWFRDYVYIPLGGNRKGTLIQIRNLLIVWMLTGIWHGANWTFLCWGIYYGVLLIIEKFYWYKIQRQLPKLVNWFITMVLVMIGWVFFASADLSSAFSYLARMFCLNLSFTDNIFWTQCLSCWWVFVVAFLWATPLFHRLGKAWQHKEDNTLWLLQPLGILFMWLIVLMYSASDSMQSFLYFQF